MYLYVYMYILHTGTHCQEHIHVHEKDWRYRLEHVLHTLAVAGKKQRVRGVIAGVDRKKNLPDADVIDVIGQ